MGTHTPSLSDLIRTQVQQAIDSVNRFLFPPACVGCGRVDALLCEGCQEDLLWLRKSICPVCEQPTTFECKCQSDLTAVYTAVAYLGPIPKAIHSLKYNGWFAVADPLADIMMQAWQVTWPLPDCIIPIPLHPEREKKRGYNQAALLAEPLSTALGVAFDPLSLKRVRHTSPQVRLAAATRQQNVSDAFWCLDRVADRTVMLVDDVYTTGATMKSAALAVKAAGAAQVYGFALAQASTDV